MKRIPWGPIRSTLFDNFSFGDIKQIVGYADLNMSELAHLEQGKKDWATKSQLLSAIDRQIGQMDDNKSGIVASICCEEMLQRKPNLFDKLECILSRIGWKFSGKALLPIEIYDISELKDIPENADKDIQKAASRLRDGDLSGSLSASCGALDSVTNAIYQEFSLGDSSKASFQERLNKSIDAIGAKKNLERELQDMGWPESDYKPFVYNLFKSLNQAAFVMQKLRSKMSDVHGTKPVITAVVYDSIKWSLLLLRILKFRKGFQEIPPNL